MSSEPITSSHKCLIGAKVISFIGWIWSCASILKNSLPYISSIPFSTSIQHFHTALPYNCISRPSPFVLSHLWRLTTPVLFTATLWQYWLCWPDLSSLFLSQLSCMTNLCLVLTQSIAKEMHSLQKLPETGMVSWEWASPSSQSVQRSEAPSLFVLSIQA